MTRLIIAGTIGALLLVAPVTTSGKGSTAVSSSERARSLIARAFKIPVSDIDGEVVAQSRDILNASACRPSICGRQLDAARLRFARGDRQMPGLHLRVATGHFELAPKNGIATLGLMPLSRDMWVGRLFSSKSVDPFSTCDLLAIVRWRSERSFEFVDGRGQVLLEGRVSPGGSRIELRTAPNNLSAEFCGVEPILAGIYAG